MLFSAAKTRAKDKGIEFSITLEWVTEILEKGICQASGIAFSFEKVKTRNPFSPSIDRKNSAIGYTTKNSQIVCTIYNNGKGEHEVKEFEELCSAVVKTNQKTMTLTKTAAYIGIPKRTFYDWLNSGRFPVDPIPGTHPRRWSVAALDAWVASNKQEHTSAGA